MWSKVGAAPFTSTSMEAARKHGSINQETLHRCTHHTMHGGTQPHQLQACRPMKMLNGVEEPLQFLSWRTDHEVSVGASLTEKVISFVSEDQGDDCCQQAKPHHRSTCRWLFWLSDRFLQKLQTIGRQRLQSGPLLSRGRVQTTMFVDDAAQSEHQGEGLIWRDPGQILSALQYDEQESQRCLCRHSCVFWKLCQNWGPHELIWSHKRSKTFFFLEEETKSIACATRFPGNNWKSFLRVETPNTSAVHTSTLDVLRV